MSCSAPTVTVGGVVLSTNDFVNAQELLTVSGDQGDPTADAYDENIANGNNNRSTSGVQFPVPTQTTLPPPITQTPQASNDTPPLGGNGVPVSCTLWVGDYDYQLSPNYKVRNFSINALWPNPVTNISLPGGTISASDRVCNLQALAVNIAEPLRARFGSFSINSGIRNANSTSTGLSQHVTGEAVDIQFLGWNYDMYWQNAQWVKDNIRYDQFIFEHSDKTGLAWFHLSFKRSGNRSPALPTKVMTMYRNRYSPGLKRFG